MVIRWESNIKCCFFARFLTNQTVFKTWDHRVRTQSQVVVVCLTTFERFTVDETFKIYNNLVAISGSFFAFVPLSLLLLKIFKHSVEVSVSYFSAAFLDFDAVKASQSDLWVHFEDCFELEIFSCFINSRLKLRHTCQLDFLLLNRLKESLLHLVVNSFQASLLTETLLQNLRRQRLTSTEARSFLVFLALCDAL